MNVVASHFFFFFFFYPPLCVIVSPSHIVPAETTYRKPRKLEAMKLHVYRGKIQVSFPYNIYSPLFIFWHTHKTKKKSVLQVLVSSASDKPLMEQPFRDLMVTGTLLPPYFFVEVFFFLTPRCLFSFVRIEKKRTEHFSCTWCMCWSEAPPPSSLIVLEQWIYLYHLGSLEHFVFLMKRTRKMHFFAKKNNEMHNRDRHVSMTFQSIFYFLFSGLLHYEIIMPSKWCYSRQHIEKRIT